MTADEHAAEAARLIDIADPNVDQVIGRALLGQAHATLALQARIAEIYAGPQAREISPSVLVVNEHF